MSFIDNYLKKHNLDDLPPSSQKELKRLEEQIKETVNSNPTKSKFEDITAKYGYLLADIVERFAKHFNSVKGFSFETIWSSLRFVINIGVEVKQLVDLMKNDIVTEDMPADKKQQAILSFGKDLVYFVWKTVDPLRDKLTWLPFKKRIEKWLVMKLAEMAIEFAGDLIIRRFGPSAKSFGTMNNGEIGIKVLEQ